MKLRKFWKIFQYIFDSDYRYIKDSRRGKYDHVSDADYLKRLYRAHMKKELNLENPQTFTEKLQWLKLHDRRPEYTQMVDKFAAKQYIAQIVGEQYVIPTLGVWENFDDIDFDSLPNQFVLKCTHDSGGLVICKDKAKLDKEKARKKISESLKRNFFYRAREWPYKNVPRRIIAEKYMSETAKDGAGEECLTDYKFFCFGGVPKIVYISKDKGKEPRTDFFDMEYNLLPIQMRDPNSDSPPSKPMLFDEMKRLAAILSKGIPHLRVDFYVVDNQVYIGELTFYHCCGFVPVKPAEWDYTLGSWIELPQDTQH